jgi:hypothetical protein
LTNKLSTPRPVTLFFFPSASYPPLYLPMVFPRGFSGKIEASKIKATCLNMLAEAPQFELRFLSSPG